MPEVAPAVAPVAAPPVAPPADNTPPAESGTPAQNEAPSADATPPGGDKPATPDQAEKRGTSRYERKISRLHKERAEAVARADLLERQLAESRAPKPSDDGRPKLEQFDYDPEKYASAVADYEKGRSLKEGETKAREHATKQYRERLTNDWEEKTANAEVKYPDFDKVVGNLEPNTPLAIAIIEAENADDVAYYLMKNQEVLGRILKLNPLAAVREIGKLEAKLLADPPVKPKTPSKAPAPISPVSGSATVSAKSLSDPEISYDEFVRIRNKELGRKTA